MDGNVIYKQTVATDYEVDERSIQRDFDKIRQFMGKEAGEDGESCTIIYDRALKGDRVDKEIGAKLSNSEILALCKILLDSRAFAKKEMKDLLAKLMECCVPKSDQKLVNNLIARSSVENILKEFVK